MAFDGTLKFDTSIDQSGFESGLSKLGTIAKRGMAAFAGAVTAAAGTVVALGKEAVNVGKGFESSMAQVIATMGISKDTIEDGVNSYDLLKKAAADAGATTTFSASEAADALNFLALAGYSAGQAADALPSVLNLAAAGGLDLAYASDLATDAMAALGIEATKGNLTRFGDEMAKTASKANTSVAQLGEAILTVGGTAKSLAGGTVELNAALGVLANRGIKGSEGGTALRNMILSLSAPTDKAADKLKELGIEVFDSTGKMRPLNEVFKDLDKSLSTMTEGEKTQVLNSIFNKVDLKSAQAMLAGCGDEFDDLTAELLNCDGAMSQMAETMNDTLEGDMKSLASKAEALGISVYEKLNAPLRELAQLGGEYISQLTSAFEDGGVEGAAAALGNIIGDVATRIAGYIPELVKIGTSLITALVKGIASNASTITKAALSAGKELVKGFFSIIPDILSVGTQVITTLVSGIAQSLPVLIPQAVGVITELCRSFVDSLPLLMDAALQLVQGLALGIMAALPVLLNALPEIIDGIISFIAGAVPQIIEVGAKLLTALVKAIPTVIKTIVGALPAVIDGIIAALLDMLPMMVDCGVQLLVALIQALPDIILSIVGALPALIDGIVKGLFECIPQIIRAGITLFTALVEELPTIINTIVMALPDIINGIIAALLDMLPLIVDCGVQLLVALVQALPDIIYAIVAVLPVIITAIIETLIGMLPLLIECGIELLTSLVAALPQIIITIVAVIPQIISSIIQALIDSYPLLIQCGIDLFVSLIGALPDIIVAIVAAIPKIIASILDALISNRSRLVKSGIELFVSLIKALPQIIATIVRAIPQIINAIVNAFKSRFPKIVDVGKNLLVGLWNGIKSAKDWVISKVKGVCSDIYSSIKSFFGISSPSKLMRDQVGKFLAEGLGVGFAEEMPQVGKDAARLVEAMKLPRPKVGIDIDDIDGNGWPTSPIRVDGGAIAALSSYSPGMLGNAIQPSATSDVVSSIANNSTSTTNNYNQSLTFNQPIQTPSQVARAARRALEVT